MKQPLDRSLVALACGVGAVALAGQSILVRELMASFYGTEPALAAALCSWLLFVPLGALAGTAAVKAVRREAGLTYAALCAMSIGVPAQFLLARLVRPVLGAGVGEFLGLGSMIAGAALAAFPVAFPVGFFFPVASRYEERRTSLPAAGISRIYVAEAVGSALAGALLSFYLLGRQSPVALACGACVLLLLLAAAHASGASGGFCAVAAGVLAALLCWSAARGDAGLFFAPVAVLAAAGLAMGLPSGGRRSWPLGVPIACAVLGLAVCVGFLAWGGGVGARTERLRWGTFSRFRLLEGQDTRYQHVEVGELEGDYVLVQNGYRSSQFPDPAASRSRAALLLVQHPRPRDILVIGGGLGGLCQQILAAPIRTLDYVEPDPQMVGLLARHLPPELSAALAAPAFAAYRYDGRHFVQRVAEDPAALAAGRLPLAGVDRSGQARSPAGRYDLVVVNIGDPTSASSSRFYTVEFCREVARVLRPGGAVAFCGITASENYSGRGAVLDYTACLYRTLRAAFGSVVVRPGSEFCFFASLVPGVVSSEPEVLTGRFDELGLEPEALKYGFELSEFPRERVQWVKHVLEQARPAALLNTDTQPVVFTLFLSVQAHYARRAVGSPGRGEPSAAADLLQHVRAAPPLLFWLPFGVVLIPLVFARLAFGRRGTAPWACGFAVLTTGMFGMAAELFVVYIYQTLFGYVYRDISIIVGLFMLGLAAGGWLMGRWASARAGEALLVGECAQALVILALPLIGGLLSFSPYAFMLLSPAVGFLTGAEFPLAARASLASGRESGTVAGALDAADHVGGLVGAACAGLLLVPALGVVRCSALLGLVKCVSLAGLLVVSAGGLKLVGRRQPAA